ncbi:TetR/AcrR family transcriptional regulator [Sphingobium sp. DC-2]|uniref:TetR/AcrR family transcriptional regulator n=1 Tax=Sphingobium sp. DC-2 TaxID=1303256 RepID=UPI00068D87EC|nr:TetR/AcrR family transcriptional regulator [Sphingobium sp. DC-2]
MEPANRRKQARRLPPRSRKGGRPTQEVAAQLLEHILDVALQEFIRYGPDGTSMERVAAAANVSKRTLYGRFASKDNLVLAAADRGMARLARPILNTVPKGSVRERILHVTRQILDVSLTESVLGLETLADWIIDRGRHKDADPALLGIDAGMKILESILTEEVEELEERAFLAKHLYYALVTIPRMRILRLGDLADTPISKDEYARRTLSLLSRGIAALAD